MKKPLTVPKVAKLLNKHPVTVREWCKAGKLSAVRVGREWIIAPDAIEQLFVKAA